MQMLLLQPTAKTCKIVLVLWGCLQCLIITWPK